MHGMSPKHFAPAHRSARHYVSIRECIMPGDVLLWRPSNVLGKFICWGTEQAYSHAAMAYWMGPTLMTIEMMQFVGCRIQRLSQQVKRWPGLCDVYRPRQPYDGEWAANTLARMVGMPYGWSDFARIGFSRVFRHLASTMIEPPKNSNSPDVPRVCSSAVAWACRVGGQREVAKYDLLVSPGDLANQHFAVYKFTLHSTANNRITSSFK
jgi:hypothetical protein